LIQIKGAKMPKHKYSSLTFVSGNIQKYKEGERGAIERVVIGYFHPDDGMQFFFGDVAGTIAIKPRGEQKFGWDPIFIPDGSNKTYGEMALEEKNHTSMRRKAAKDFAKYLAQHFEL
jgi:XTP/dITP diphosphohydrolase